MYAQYNNLCQFGLLSQAYQPISPSILIHFRWELYHRLSDSDRQADGLWEVSYRWAGSERWSDGLVKMADEWSDNDGQSDRWGKMVYRWSDGDGQSDRWIVGLVVGVTDGHVNEQHWWVG